MENRNLPLLLASLAALLTASALHAAPATPERDFTLKVLPLLKSKCFACHGEDPKKIKGDLNMLTREGLLKGGENSDKVLVPGNAKASDMFVAVTWKDKDLEMPPKENDRLTHGADRAGASMDRRRRAVAGRGGAEEAARGGMGGRVQRGWRDLEDERRAGGRVDLPALQAGGSLGLSAGEEAGDRGREMRENPGRIISSRAKLATAKVAARRAGRSADADSPRDLRSARPAADAGGDRRRFSPRGRRTPRKAWSDLIDRLLASPHYGERWAQHWLDVTRYADTGGMANDFERSNMWRYRDYVIRAFNTDKPYNEFVLEQLAGDQLADASAAKRLGGDAQKVAEVRKTGDYTEEEAEKIVATGFLRMGPWDNAMIKDEEARQIYRDDLVNNIGQTFLATTLRCFKCHDHKFDPLPTRDYYRIYSAISGTQMAERPLRFLPEEKRDGFEEGKAFVEKMLAFASGEKNKIVEKREAAAREWFKEHGLPYKSNEARQKLPDEEKPPRAVGLDHVEEGQLKVREQDEWIWQRALERYEPMVQSVYDGPDPKLNFASGRKLRMPEVINANWRPDSHIFTGGSLEAPGEKVQPGVLSAIGLARRRRAGRSVCAAGGSDRPPARAGEVDRRRAQSADHALHREPRLAVSFRQTDRQHAEQLRRERRQAHASRIARLAHRRFRRARLDAQAPAQAHHDCRRPIRWPRSTRRCDKLRNDDPNNDLFAYFPHRRLTAEEMRDAMLRVTGELNPTLGGLPDHAGDQPRSRAAAAHDSVLAGARVSALAHAAGAQSPQHLRLPRARPGRPVPRGLQSAESERILRPARLRRPSRRRPSR